MACSLNILLHGLYTKLASVRLLALAVYLIFNGRNCVSCSPVNLLWPLDILRRFKDGDLGYFTSYFLCSILSCLIIEILFSIFSLRLQSEGIQFVFSYDGAASLQH